MLKSNGDALLRFTVFLRFTHNKPAKRKNLHLEKITMRIAITGATGNMGQAAVAAIASEEYIEKINILSHSKKRTKKLLNKHKELKKKVIITEGSLANPDVCAKLIDGADIVINMGAVIPPKSDQMPERAIECNEQGVRTLVRAIEQAGENQPKLVHISTVALYGNRTAPHLFGRVGDPLLVSPFDIYSATKLRGEFCVLESTIKHWAVLRQTAMLHPNMLADNVHDGLMFHTCFNAPLEWATAHDSGILIRNILRKEAANEMPDSFWKKCYNIAGGAINRIYGIDTLNDGFALIGGSAKQFFKPGYNATRNFHGVWYSDGHLLNDLFDYQKQSVTDYWQEVLRKHKIYKLGKIVPKSLIRHFAVKRLLKDPNSPAYWAKHNDEARLTAYFGSREEYEKLQQTTWNNMDVPARPSPDIKADNENPVFYGYDFFKSDNEIDLSDLKSVAKAHGGKLLSENFATGDMYAKLEWETQDGEKFTATPYSVLRAGHWYNPIYRENVWDFDRLSKKDEIFASVWYDSHRKDENMRYGYDEKFNARAEKICE